MNIIKYFDEVDFQNGSSLITSILSYYNIHKYYNNNNILYIHISLLLVEFHCITDLLRDKTIDIIIHHINSILIGIFFYKYVPMQKYIDEIILILKFEISTIFLASHHFIKKYSYLLLNNNYANILSNIVLLLFVISFIYIRIYCYTKQIFDKDFNNRFYKIT